MKVGYGRRLAADRYAEIEDRSTGTCASGCCLKRGGCEIDEIRVITGPLQPRDYLWHSHALDGARGRGRHRRHGEEERRHAEEPTKRKPA